MHRYVMNPKPEKSVRVYGRALRISLKDSMVLCKAISGMTLPKGKQLLENLVTEKTSLGGKYYTSTAQTISGLLQSAETATEFKGLTPERMFIHASAHQGFSFQTPRRFKHRGKSRNVTHVQLILQQR